MQEEYLALTFVANKVCTPRISGLVLHGIAVRQGFDHRLGILVEDKVFDKVGLKLGLPHVAHIELLCEYLFKSLWKNWTECNLTPLSSLEHTCPYLVIANQILLGLQ